MRLGFGIGINDVETILRALPSMALRYAEHDRSARALALWCQHQAEVVQVLHPALPASPGHVHWQTLCRTKAGERGGAAGLFSILLDPKFTRYQVDAFCDALRLFKLGYSWGGPMSLVVPYDLGTMRSVWPAHLKQGHLLRFSTGLEAVADLQADLAQALAAALQ